MQTMLDVSVYAEPRLVSDPSACYFYHTQDIPGHGLVEGEWDLREGITAYLGHVAFGGKRVLELGTADGFLSFAIERQGAEVVSYDLSEGYTWDIVPFEKYDHATFGRGFMAGVSRVNNSYWFCHRAHRSQARMVYGEIYAIPEAIGPVDISIFGAILCHVRDPFLALQQGARLTKETVIVTDGLRRFGRLRSFERVLPPPLRRPSLRFLPDWRTGEPKVAWWEIGPEAVRRFLGVLGFEDTRVTYHRQCYRGRNKTLFTVVSRRTQPTA